MIPRLLRARWAGAILLTFIACATVLLLPADSSASNATNPADWPQIGLTLVAQGIYNPSAIAYAPDGSGRLFIAATNGRIWFIRSNDSTPHQFVNINEQYQGRRLFGLAFSPNYASDGSFYVHYLDGPTSQVVVARYFVSPEDPDVANPSSHQEVLRVPQTAFLHSGGQLAFGPDGYLYIAVGDGDFDNDPENDAQNTGNMLGSILRIDVSQPPQAADRVSAPLAGTLSTVAYLPLVGHSRGFTYNVPASNPFVGMPGRAPEIWAYGLRNPWRFSFDRLTGDLYIADVGQSRREEINYQLAASVGGQNYGWRVMEGTLCFDPANCDPGPYVPPVAEYGHSAGNCAVIGGEVYRGAAYPMLQGIYVYGDHCTGRIWGLRRTGLVWQTQELAVTGFRLSDIGDDADGNIYVTDFDNGQIYKVVAQ